MIGYTELIQDAAEKEQIEYSLYTALIDAYFKVVTEHLSRGESVTLQPDFGHIVLKESGGREAGCGEILTKKRYTPSFKTAGSLKGRLRQTGKEYADMLREHGMDRQAETFEMLEREMLGKEGEAP